MTGQGQHIDLSQMVASVPLVGPAMLDFTVNGRGLAARRLSRPATAAHWPGTPVVNNYRGPTVAPHNAYRTARGGYNDWCVIVCQSDERVAAPGAGDGRSLLGADAEIRHRGRDACSIRRSWTTESRRGRRTLEQICGHRALPGGGVRAMPVQSAEDRVEHDPQLHHREMYVPIEHPALGMRKVQNAPFKLSETPAVQPPVQAR